MKDVLLMRLPLVLRICETAQLRKSSDVNKGDCHCIQEKEKLICRIMDVQDNGFAG
jgi:hypothetical protein